MNRELKKQEDWGAHAAVHAAFAEGIARLYDNLGDPLIAYVVLAGLRDDLLRHMRYEESRVLPVYEERIPHPLPAARADAYRRDHELLRRRLEDLSVLSLRVGFRSVPPSMLEYAVSELDELLEHHDERERRHLYPALEQALAPEERRQLLRELEESGPRNPATAVAEARRLIAGEAFMGLATRYRAWLELRSGQTPNSAQARERLLAPPPDAGVLEAVPGVSSLDRMLARAQELSARFLDAEPRGIKARVQAERRVDQAWRSLVGLVLGSIIR